MATRIFATVDSRAALKHFPYIKRDMQDVPRYGHVLPVLKMKYCYQEPAWRPTCTTWRWSAVAKSAFDVIVAHRDDEYISRNGFRCCRTGVFHFRKITGTMPYDIFRSITRLQTVLLHSIHCSTNSAYYSILYLNTQTNHVCDFIIINYTSMTHCEGIY